MRCVCSVRSFFEYLQSLPPQKYVLIPVPLSSKRLRERGYNQTELIARRSLSRAPLFSVRADILRRTRNTQSQTSLLRKDRIANLKGAFELTKNAPNECSGTHIILFDDVVTTGTTLLEAKKALGGISAASIRVVALAH